MCYKTISKLNEIYGESKNGPLLLTKGDCCEADNKTLMMIKELKESERNHKHTQTFWPKFFISGRKLTWDIVNVRRCKKTDGV